MEYSKNHDNWNKLKKILDWIPIAIPFKEKEIWWCALGINIGSEIDGKGKDDARPIIIITKFNHESAFVIPLSQVGKVQPYIHIQIQHSKLGQTTYAVANQIQTINSKRLLEKIGEIDSVQFEILTEKIKKVLFPKNNKT